MAIRAPAIQQNSPSKTWTLDDVDIRDEESIVCYVQQRWESRSSTRLALERQWWLNIAFFLGYQYHTFDPKSGVLYQPKAPPWRVRLACNRIMPIVRKNIAKAVRQRPIFTTIPATGDAEDAAISVVGSKLLQSYWRTLEWDRKIIEFSTWLFTTGNVFGRVYWDPMAGPPLSVSPEEAMQLGVDPSMVKRLEKADLHLGDLAMEPVSPLEIDPHPATEDFDEAPDIIHSKFRTVDYLRRRYESAREIEADSDNAQTTGRFYEQRIKNMLGPQGFTGANSNGDQGKEGCHTHQLWINPCKKYSRGAYAVVAGGKVLKALDHLPVPRKIGRAPYVHAREIVVPGRLWGASIIEQLIPLQVEYNRARSQLIEIRNLHSKPKWLIPSTCNLPEGALTSEPGEKVVYQYGGGKPELSTPPPLPDWVRQGMEYTLKDMEDTGSTHEVTQARAPSGVRSGVAIAQLQEQDDQNLAPTFFLMERALSKLGSWALMILAENMTEERIIRIVGNDRQMESFVFTGKQLLGKHKDSPGADYFDVECQMTSQLPLSRAGRIQTIMDLINMRVLDPVADRKKILRVLEIGIEEPVINDQALDRQAAMRENYQLVHGVSMEINPWDDDALHMEEHRRFQKQPEYAVVASPQAIRAAEAHMALHAMRIMGQTPTVSQQQDAGVAPIESEPGTALSMDAMSQMPEIPGLAPPEGEGLPPEMEPGQELAGIEQLG